MNGFIERSHSLPFLGIGVSTEYGAYHGDNGYFRLSRSISRIWVLKSDLKSKGLILSLNLGLNRVVQRPITSWISIWTTADFDAYWLDQVREHIAAMKPAGYAAMLTLAFWTSRTWSYALLPPVLSDDWRADLLTGSSC